MSAEENKKNMTYVRLGNSGLKVSRLILGLMSYGTKGWAPWVVEKEEAIKHIKTAYDAGIQTFDTANVYSNGESERILGEAIRQLKLPRDEIVVMTKLWGVVGRTPGESYMRDPAAADAYGYVNQYGLGRKHIFESVKHSLERLQLEYVDVLQCHRFDYDTPIEETMQALHDVVKAGYARYIGMSSCHAYQFHAMQNYAINNKLTPFISMQNHYNLLYREEEREMVPTLKMFGVGMIPWSPLSRGALARPFSESTLRSQGDPMAALMNQTRESNKEIITRVEQIAKARNVSMAQVGLAWVLSKDHTSAPIIGITNLENFQDTIGALQVKLTEEEIKQLEEPYGPRGIVGHIRLGNSGLKVSRIILGLMSYGSKEWDEWLLGEEEGIRHIKRAQLGIQTFDTANIYSNGESERILGKAIKQLNFPRDEIVVMTKVYGVVARTPAERYMTRMAEVEARGYVNQSGLSRKHIFESIKHSLERLQLEYVDVLQCHRFDYNTPIEETMKALHDVVKAGYARYIGMSSCYAYQFHAMQNYAINKKLTPFISMQNHYSLLYREEEREMVPTLKMFGVGMIPWSALARGILTRPVSQYKTTARSQNDPWAKNYDKTKETNDKIVSSVEAIAKSKGISMAQVAIAWCLSKDGMAAPIIGTTKLENLEDIIGSCVPLIVHPGYVDIWLWADGIHVKLTEDEIKRLEEPYTPQGIVGHA
ncbi:Aldo kereductase [Rhizoctonia solani]|uniref:Aldo kereductase n=1 Tax=Rhizoctonia solani TaxID=456999 RepID=A0A8H7HJE8_9AGAM|nr:Aldo kereductase [Rhizoctonia solani]